MWKTIEEFPNYEVSDKGDIRRKGARIVRKPFDNHGYLVVGLNCKGKQINRLVHRLVAKAFITNTLNKREINHIDGNKLNNAVSNLEWVTASENLTHAYSTGLRSSQKLLTHTQIQAIKSEYIPKSRTHGSTALGIKYGVSRKTIIRAVES